MSVLCIGGDLRYFQIMAIETGTPPETSPYRSVFRHIEYLATFYPDNVSPFMPSMAYRLYYDEIQQRDIDPDIYVSMAITSGGFARDESLSIGEVIDQNNRFGDDLRTLLTHNYGFASQSVLVPSELGKVQAWSQADYLMFWFHCMSGVSPGDARDIEKRMSESGVYSPGPWTQLPMTTAENDLKRQAYCDFARTYVESLHETVGSRPGLFNMRAVIGGLDTDRSHGAAAEFYFAQLLGMPYYSIFAVESAIPEAMRPRVMTLQALGAKSLFLVEDGGSTHFSGTRSQSRFDLSLRSMGLFRSKEIFEAKTQAPRYRRH